MASRVFHTPRPGPLGDTAGVTAQRGAASIRAACASRAALVGVRGRGRGRVGGGVGVRGIVTVWVWVGVGVGVRVRARVS